MTTDAAVAGDTDTLLKRNSDPGLKKNLLPEPTTFDQGVQLSYSLSVSFAGVLARLSESLSLDRLI